MQYRADLPGATVWLENAGATIDLFDTKAISAIAHGHTDHSDHDREAKVRHHAIKLAFNGGHRPTTWEALGVRPGAYHFLLGDDPRSWASGVHAFSTAVEHDVLPGIDVRYRCTTGSLKYDIIVEPGADPRALSFTYAGAVNIEFSPQRLSVHTELGISVETIPLAYQEEDGIRVPVPCTYRRVGAGVGFEPGPYDRSKTLIIDPSLVFSTYSGSLANNFGYTATFDRDGFLYSGSTAFGQGYPTTLGAYDIQHAGGDGLFDGTDIAITKYDTTGTQLIWSTYIGGSSDELPHSLVVNANDELFLYGTTSSPDIPTTTGAFDNAFTGGPPVNLTNGLGADMPNGVDIFVARLSADGSQLLAGTYLGGSATDGLNTAPGLKFNYADEVRGEILLDANDNVLIATSTASTDFPTTANAAFTDYRGGAQDGVFVKMDAALTTLISATYFGGAAADAIYNIELDENGGTYITGGTRSTDLPISTNALQSAFQGGNADGFVAKLLDDGSDILHCSYFGTSDYDQCYFADLDQQGNVFLFGQTAASGSQLIVNAPYNIPGAGQFITKLTNDLSTLLISTRFGQGDGIPDISPTAFLVDYCNKVYVSGWGSAIQGGGLSTTGLAVTTNGFQQTTDGNDLYLAVFDIDLSALFYATYFGGNVSGEHVDGGTSRFDRRGRVYQSVCAGCGGNSDFPIQPANAWSPTNNSGFCNNAVLKFDLDIPMVVAEMDVRTNCLPDPITFVNTSSGATSFFWDLGDGTTSNAVAPQHVYGAPGVYTVRLVAFNPATCNMNDTTTQQVVVLGTDGINLPDTTVCAGGSVQIGIAPIVGPGISYQWSPASGLSNTRVPNPIANPASTTAYTLTVSNGDCTSIVQQVVTVYRPTIDAGVDQTLCGPVATAQLVANGSGTLNAFQWSSSNAFNDALNGLTSDSTASVQVSTDSWFFVRDPSGSCSAMDSVFIDVPLGGIALDPVEAICTGDTGAINLIGADPGSAIVWSPDEFITLGQGTTQIRTRAPTTTTFFVQVTSPSGCSWSASIQQVVSPLNASSIQATATPAIIIGGGTVQLQARPSGLSYSWTPAQPLNDPLSEDPTAAINSTTLFTVNVSDGICQKDAQVLVEVRELLCQGPDIFVPNTFTPNGDGENDVLFVRGRNIGSLRFLVFDRWGEKVFETADISLGWDGTYNGEPVDPAVFVYHLTANCVDGQNYFTKGNVTVVR